MVYLVLTCSSLASSAGKIIFLVMPATAVISLFNSNHNPDRNIETKNTVFFKFSLVVYTENWINCRIAMFTTAYLPGLTTHIS